MGLVSGELEPRVVEGRVIAGGVAQETMRQDGVTRVRLTVFGSLAPKLDYEAMASGGIVHIPLPEPVTAREDGEVLAVEIEWHPGPVRESPGREAPSQPSWPRRDASPRAISSQ